jgi:hypothetical protein
MAHGHHLVCQGFGIGVDLTGSAHVAGFTESNNLALVNPFQAAFGGVRDAFVSKIVENNAVITDIINLLVQGADLALTEPKAELAMPNPDSLVIAQRAQMLSYIALAIALVALGVAAFK